jgi:hypothetical protein
MPGLHAYLNDFPSLARICTAHPPHHDLPPSAWRQCGASWAGAPVGFLAQHYGWQAIWALWTGSVVTAGVLLALPNLMLARRGEDVGVKVD